MAEHILKTVEPYFDAVASGRKLFEVRKNDRFFQAGDIATLVWWSETHDHRGNRHLTDGDKERALKMNPKVRFRVGPVLQGGQFGIEPGYCVFSLLPLESTNE